MIELLDKIDLPLTLVIVLLLCGRSDLARGIVDLLRNRNSEKTLQIARRIVEEIVEEGEQTTARTAREKKKGIQRDAELGALKVAAKQRAIQRIEKILPRKQIEKIDVSDLVETLIESGVHRQKLNGAIFGHVEEKELQEKEIKGHAKD